VKQAFVDITVTYARVFIGPLYTDKKQYQDPFSNMVKYTFENGSSGWSYAQ